MEVVANTWYVRLASSHPLLLLLVVLVLLVVLQGKEVPVGPLG